MVKTVTPQKTKTCIFKHYNTIKTEISTEYLPKMQTVENTT